MITIIIIRKKMDGFNDIKMLDGFDYKKYTNSMDELQGIFFNTCFQYFW